MSQTLEMVLRQTATLSADELAVSVGLAKTKRLPLWDFLMRERRVPEDVLAEAFSKALKLPRVCIAATSIEAAAIEAVAGWLAYKHTCLPIRHREDERLARETNPLDSMAIKDVQFASSRHVSTVEATSTDI